MKNIILGSLVAIWGAAVLIVALVGSQHGNGAYGAGQAAGLVFAIVMIIVGTQAIRKGRHERRD
jgi:hypothetical protein